MSKMKSKLMLAGVFATIAIGIAWATPGSGVTTTSLSGPVVFSVSPFAGSWSGPWIGVGVEVPHHGTFDWTISNSGQLSGSAYHAEDGVSGAVVGHVRADGKVTMAAFVPADPPSHGNGFPYRGTAVINSDGKLKVSISNTSSVPDSFVAILDRN